MDTGEFILTLFVSIIAGCVSLIFLKFLFPDFILSWLIDILEYIGDQVYYQATPITDAIFVANQDDTYNSSQIAYDVIRFGIGFAPTFLLGMLKLNR